MLPKSLFFIQIRWIIWKKVLLLHYLVYQGAGKSYFIKSMTERFESFEKLKAVTTREKRKDEVEGVDKFFLDLNSFEEKIKMAK